MSYISIKRGTGLCGFRALGGVAAARAAKANRRALIFEIHAMAQKKPVNARRSAPTGWFRIKP
jgi:hypothetical protein